VAHSPFSVMQDPYQPEFQHDQLQSAVRSLELANDITLDRINDRKSLLTGLDRLPRLLDSKRAQDGLDPFAKLAMELVTTGKARRAFDLNQESAATRHRYGLHRWGQMALLARRLVESTSGSEGSRQRFGPGHQRDPRSPPYATEEQRTGPHRQQRPGRGLGDDGEVNRRFQAGNQDGVDWIARESVFANGA